MKHPSLRGSASIALALAMAGAHAEDAGHLVTERDHVTYTVATDGSYVLEEDVVLRALTQEGANALVQRYVSYQESRQTLENLKAETLPAHGPALPVGPAGFQTQSGVLGDVSQPDVKKVQISFPHLNPGDAVHWHFRLKTRKPDFTGYFGSAYIVDTGLIARDVEIRLDVPANFALQLDAHDAKQIEDRTGDGRRVLRWAMANATIAPRDANALDTWRNAPYLFFGNFPDWCAFGDAFQQGMAAKARVTPDIRTLADQLTQAATSQADQVEKLYDWVRGNIRYAAIQIDDGGYVPHDAATVLATRYGDCKDHVTLLGALLAAKGIASSPALIVADTANYRLPQVANSWFNHVITYVPSLDRYLDSTGATLPFGQLPEVDTDKPVLLTAAPSHLGRTPPTRAESYRMARKTVIDIADDLSAMRTTEVDSSGLAFITSQDFIRQMGVGGGANWAINHLHEQGFEGKSSLAALPVQGGRYRYVLTQQIDGYLDGSDFGSLGFPHAVDGPIAVERLIGSYGASNRSQDFFCAAFGVDDTVEYRFPPSVRPLRVPRDTRIDDDWVSLDIRYRHEGARIVRQARLDFKSPSADCSSSDYQRLRPIMQRVQRAWDGELLYDYVPAAKAGAENGR